jgi:hypothetical protein
MSMGYQHVGFEVLIGVVIKNSIFWDLIPYGLLKINQQAVLADCITLVSCLAYSSTMKIEATCPSETLVDFQWNTHIISQKTELFGMPTFFGLNNNHYFQNLLFS